MALVPPVSHSSYRAVRAVRAALFAVVCVGVGATLHGAAGGCHPTWASIGLALAAVWSAAWFGLTRERSWPALTVALGSAQIGLHLLFTHLDTGAATAHATAPTMPNMSAMATAQPGPFATALTMITAHALAAVICGWWLGQGERDFFALWRAVGALAAAPLHRLTAAVAALAAIARLVTHVVPHIKRVARQDRVRLRPAPLLTALTFRGPPVVA